MQAKMTQIIEDKYLSIKLTRFFMKFVGFWKSKNRREELWLNIRLTYTVGAMIFAIGVLGGDFLHCLGDFDAVMYNVCGTMPVVVVLVKLTIFIVRRDDVINLIDFAEKYFWNVNYDDFGKQIMNECERKGVIFLFTFTLFVSGTVFNYLFAPVIENIGQDPSDRVLPFKLWLNLPLTVTPYFEITYTFQGLSTIHSGICFFCFDNLMCILSIHVVGQFKILQHRLRTLCQKYSKIRDRQDEMNTTDDVNVSNELYREFILCVNQHRALIKYVELLERVFTLILLQQMLVSSLLMCFSGFQLCLANWNVVRRLIFVSHLLASTVQLLLITWTSNDIIEESVNVGDAAYDSEWYAVPHHGVGVSLRRGMLIVMARVKHPCYLSAGKFCPMSLQAFTAIVSTAMSYFTLLRQMSEQTTQ